jgi:2',3'-cyclic-nucleotide 2'-phosphodiesterase (5'-nucleotidase family)
VLHFNRRKLLLLPLLALCLSCWAPARAPEAATGPQHLVVLHTNDIHGQVLPRDATWLDDEHPPLIGGLERLAARIAQESEEARRSGAGVLVVDGGDWFQGTPEGMLEDGRDFLEALARVGHDVLCVGNHEFDHGVETIEAHLKASKLPAVLANLRGRADGKRPAWVKPWRIFKRAGLKIAVVGLLTPATPEITDDSVRAFEFVDPALALEEVRRELGDSVDLVLPLTHLGVNGDRDLARAHGDLPLIVGGHSHTYLPEGLREGEVLIAQAGSKASALGRVDLWFDRESGECLRSRSRLIDLMEEARADDLPPGLVRACEHLVKRSSGHMDSVVGELATPLSRSRHPLETAPAGNLITDVMRRRTDADVALQNRGGIRCDLAAGPVTRRDLFEILPFGNHLVTVTLTGAELLATLRRAVEGQAHSGLEFSGLVLEVREGTSGNEVLGVAIGGEPLALKREYRVTLNSFLAGGGDAYLELGGELNRVDDRAALRDVMEEAFAQAGVLTPPTENRYRRRR